MTLVPDQLQYQVATETVRGTPVTPTVKLMGIKELTITPIVTSEGHQDQRGSFAPAHEADLVKQEVEVDIEGALLFEDLPYWLDSLLGQATPSGAGPYVRAYTAPLETPPTPRILTAAKGNGSNVYGANGVVLDELTLTFEKNAEATFSAHGIGTAAATDTLAALSDRTVNHIMGHHLALYIDAFGGTIGTTAFADIYNSLELNIKTNRANAFSLGSLGPKKYREAKYEGTLKASLEFDTASKAYLDAILGASSVLSKLIRVKATKSAAIVQLDFAGFTPESPELFSDDDGVVTLETEFSGLYEAGLANWFAASITNGVAVLA